MWWFRGVIGFVLLASLVTGLLLENWLQVGIALAGLVAVCFGAIFKWKTGY